MARILVVDDEANIRMMMRLALHRLGHEVDTAADGPEGLDKFADGCDLVLLDQRMPGMEGLEVLREMRRRDPEARVIMITAFGTVDLVVDAMKGGARDFLRKPFTLETLYGAVDAALLEPSERPSIPAYPAEPVLSFMTLNGFRIEALRHPIQRRGGEIRQMLTVRSPNGNLSPCEVVVTPLLASQVKADVGLDDSAQDEGFWRGLCEEALASHLWQNPQMPFGGVLHVDEYTTSLRRWVLSAATQRREAGQAATR